jgi:hypothetical protein
MTEAQGEKLTRWAKQIGGNRVTLMFDCESTGVEGAKETGGVLCVSADPQDSPGL